MSISCLVFVWAQKSTTFLEGNEIKEKPELIPNILILSADGLEASHMSAYGYSRKTTPFIENLLKESVIFENHFTNSSRTTGSVGSLFSGKLNRTR